MTGPDDLAAVKRAARAAARARRDAAHAAGGSEAGEAAAALLDGVVHRTPACAGGYLPINSEIDARPAMARLAARGAGLALPVSFAGAPLNFAAWTFDAPTRTGAFGVAIPLDDLPAEPDLLIVPLLAFDRRGYRLGYGGGHYDRTLAALRALRPVLAIGLAYAAQEIEAVPVGPHDAALDMVVTEREVIACG
jgi:5-formyltetrahydrofolate cyclo-ligase